MKKAGQLLKNINVINLFLTGLLIFFVNYTVLPFFHVGVTFTLPAVKKPDLQKAVSGEKTAESRSPFPSDFIIIAEQNLFHPDRKIPLEKKEAQPLPAPDFILYGTLLTDDVKIAYMEDKKSPVSTPGREKRQTSLRPGDSLGGFTLKEIAKDRVIMARGEEKLTIYLDDPHKPKTRDAFITTAPSHIPQTQPASRPGILPPQPAATRQPSATQPPVAPADKGTAVQPSVTPDSEKASRSFLDFFRQKKR
ncbi:MAG: hypothetical protein HZA17_00760 [Nitrospirae bacterium]|nr:hypothetical protein [Nitrospirota bacterium]